MQVDLAIEGPPLIQIMIHWTPSSSSEAGLSASLPPTRRASPASGSPLDNDQSPGPSRTSRGQSTRTSPYPPALTARRTNLSPSNASDTLSPADILAQEYISAKGYEDLLLIYSTHASVHDIWNRVRPLFDFLKACGKLGSIGLNPFYSALNKGLGLTPRFSLVNRHVALYNLISNHRNSDYIADQVSKGRRVEGMSSLGKLEDYLVKL